MDNARKKLLEKIKAILSKTMANGCTEDEAMAALAKARELMATYEIDESELGAQQQEGARIHKTGMSDPYDIKKGLVNAVGKFTRCMGYNASSIGDGMCFCGLESDVLFAEWLLETLKRFVMRELRGYQANRMKLKIPTSNLNSVSFVIGCTTRIAEKLKELTPIEPTGKGLVVSRNALILAELARNGIMLHKARNSDVRIDANAHKSGQKAGDGATFSRPLNQSDGQLLLK